MASARVHNAVLSRVRAWTSLVGRLNPRLAQVLRDDPAAVELLAGTRATAALRVPDPADLLVLLDHLNLHAGRQLWLAPGPAGEYVVTDAAEVDDGARGLAHRFTGQPDCAEFLPWPGRIDQVALITCDRPETVAGTLDSYLDNLRRFRRAYATVTVYDDSGPAAGGAVRRLVASRRAGGGRVRYVGPAEKRRLRASLTGRLPEPPPPEVLDALLGRSAAGQRNWATLLGAGTRVLIGDDDARPEVLDLPLASLRAAGTAAVPALHRAAAPVWPGELIEAAAPAGVTPVAWRSDLLGRFEQTEPALVSAAYTGHLDRRTSLWLERFFEFTDESVDVLGTGAPLRPVRRERPAPGHRKFRGGTYVTSGSLEGVEFAVRRDRNEDFSLALSQRLTSRLQPRELENVHMLHQRGARHTRPFTAHRQEQEGNLVNRLIATVCEQAWDADPWRMSERGLRVLEGYGDGGLGRELFAEGVAYRRRALAHLAWLEEGPPVASRWFRDPSPRRARLLRAGARRLRAGRSLPAAVLTECLHVLVPEQLASCVERRVVGRELRALPAAVRARAVAALEREAASLRRWNAAPAQARLAGRLARKRELVAGFIEEIDAELGNGFAEQVQERVLADVRLFLRTLPWFYALRAVWLLR